MLVALKTKTCRQGCLLQLNRGREGNKMKKKEEIKITFLKSKEVKVYSKLRGYMEKGIT